jgi:hypothetical protein
VPQNPSHAADRIVGRASAGSRFPAIQKTRSESALGGPREEAPVRAAAPRPKFGIERSKSEIPFPTSTNAIAALSDHSALEPDGCKHIYIVSDSTGFTASHALTSVMAQFETLAVDWNGQEDPTRDTQASGGAVQSEVRTQMFSNVKVCPKHLS